MLTKLQAGAFRTTITPPLGSPLEGAFDYRGADKILDDLHVNALVLDDGEKEIALLSIDVCMIPRSLFEEMASDIHQTSQIAEENIIIAVTHTHAGPVTEDFPSADLYADKAYISQLKGQITTAVLMAQQDKRPVKVGVGKGENRDLVFNRRLHRPDGRIVMNWIDPDQLTDCKPGGMVDADVFAVKLIDEHDRVVAVIANYANHNNAAPSNSISADMAGTMGDVLRKIYGVDTVVLFLLGACGNTNWIDVTNPACRQPDWYRTMGYALAGSILELEGVMTYPEVKSVGVQRHMVQIPDRPHTEYDITDDGTFGEGPGVEGFFRGYRQAQESAAGKPLKVNDIDITVLTMGDEIAIVTNPTEAFAEIALEIKEKSPYQYTIFSELTNGAEGYVPTRQAYEEGGYEVRKIPLGSHLAIDAAEKFVEYSLTLLKKAKSK